MSDCHVQRRLRGGIGGKSILHLAEVALRSGVTRHEDDGPNGYISLEKFLGSNDWSNSIGVQMKSELVKGTTTESAHTAHRFISKAAN